MKFAEKVVKKLIPNLKRNGCFAIYSPHIEQVKKVRKELNGFDIVTIENIVREWKVTEDYTHPISTGIIHTGFLTIARRN